MTRQPGDWAAWIDGRLDRVRADGQWRAPREFDAWGPRGALTATGRVVVSFASNDYLGLTTHPAVLAAAADALEHWGSGSGGARLITGTRPVHTALERELADWKGTERAVLFPTGFATNLGVLTTLGDAGVRIVSDERNHASIIDGARLARGDVSIWRHADGDRSDDLAELERLVSGSAQAVLVVADTVFSMDGDALDVAAVAAICRRHGALLVLDEAHAVLGPEPSPADLAGIEVVRVGTLSKTLGSLGGFAACSERVADLLVNKARPGIFTTAPSPADTAAGLAALRVLRSDEGHDLCATLRRHVDRLRPGHPSPIVPIVLGDEQRALAAAEWLLTQGLLVPAIRPPTVAPGTSRLRITFSAAHSDDDVDRLMAALATLESPADATHPVASAAER
ncbi:MAG: 7-keto-8-aminopelargonate synthetase-like enzyme [Acidimicrobiales bacterium]|nr:7-keto-8-aminopelargonate synthetase-like enzyme [Acidimicrobiales bacterium]